jgi:hypothetical protein
MNATEIRKMSVDERLQAMEILWDSLLDDEVEISSPDWHREILRERLTRLRLFASIFCVTPCLAVTAGAKVGTTRRLVEAGFQGGGDPRWGLRGQLQPQPLE